MIPRPYTLLAPETPIEAAIEAWADHIRDCTYCHHAAPPRGPLRYEIHRGGKVASRHATVTAMLLAKLEKGGERMVRVGAGVVPWVRGGGA